MENATQQKGHDGIGADYGPYEAFDIIPGRPAPVCLTPYDTSIGKTVCSKVASVTIMDFGSEKKHVENSNRRNGVEVTNDQVLLDLGGHTCTTDQEST